MCFDDRACSEELLTAELTQRLDFAGQAGRSRTKWSIREIGQLGGEAAGLLLDSRASCAGTGLVPMLNRCDEASRVAGAIRRVRRRCRKQPRQPEGL